MRLVHWHTAVHNPLHSGLKQQDCKYPGIYLLNELHWQCLPMERYWNVDFWLVLDTQFCPAHGLLLLVWPEGWVHEEISSQV